MTQPNPVIAGAMLNITRRTLGGQFFLRPDPVVNQTFQYTLAACAQKHGLELHASVALSNHHHTIATDPYGQHPSFRQDLHSFLTRSLNRHHGLEGAKWDPGKNVPTILCDREAQLQSIAYAIANGCRHHLVESPEDWPGFVSLIEDLGGPPRMLRKPKGFYDPDGELPDQVPLAFTKPAVCADMPDEEYRDEIRKRVVAICARARQERLQVGRTVPGRHSILRQHPTDVPTRQPALHSLKPVVKCVEVTLRIAMLRWLKAFRVAYKAARQTFESGETEVVFPRGTYLLGRRYRVHCDSTGPPMLAG